MKLSKSKIIEHTPTLITYLLNYTGGIVLFYGCVSLFLIPFIIGGLQFVFLGLPRAITLSCKQVDLAIVNCQLTESSLGVKVKSVSLAQLLSAKVEERNEAPFRTTYKVALYTSNGEVHYFGLYANPNKEIVQATTTRINNFVAHSKETSLTFQDSRRWDWPALLAGVPFAAIPLGGLVWLVQTIGFCETWIFDKVLAQVTIKRRLALGTKIMQYPSRDISEVKVSLVLPTNAHSPERYEVSLISSSLNLGGGATPNHRVLYDSPDPKNAKEMAEIFRTYLNLPLS